MLLPFWSEIKKTVEAPKRNGNGSFVVSAETPAEPVSSETDRTFAVSRDELGRATWTLLHSIASYYPDKPTRQQQKDVKSLVRSKTDF